MVVMVVIVTGKNGVGWRWDHEETPSVSAWHV